MDVVLIVCGRDKETAAASMAVWQARGHKVLVLDDKQSPSGLVGDLGRIVGEYNDPFAGERNFNEKVKVLQQSTHADFVCLAECDLFVTGNVGVGQSFRIQQRADVSSYIFGLTRTDVNKLQPVKRWKHPDRFFFWEFMKQMDGLGAKVYPEKLILHRLDYLKNRPTLDLTKTFTYIGDSKFIYWYPTPMRKRIQNAAAIILGKHLLHNSPFHMPKTKDLIPDWSK